MLQMRQQQPLISQEKPFIESTTQTDAKRAYYDALGKAVFPLLLFFGGVVAYLFVNHLPPYQKFRLLDDFPKLVFPLPLAFFLAHHYARWACKRKGVSLENEENTAWRRKPTLPMEAVVPFGIGSKGSISRIAGALGTLVFLGFLALMIWLLSRGGISPKPDFPLIRYVFGMVLLTGMLVVTFGIGIAGLLMSLTALRSGGELVRVDAEGISWIRGGKRHVVPWAKLSRAEVTRGYDVKGELVKLEVRFYDNEDELQGTLSFGAERPASLPRTFVPWSKELEGFASELQATFDTLR